MRKGRAKEGPGLSKVLATCALARNQKLEWVWIDTYCIDKKKSSAELSEAINSMFRWYGFATECDVYLSDVDWEYKDAVYCNEKDAQYSTIMKSKLEQSS